MKLAYCPRCHFMFSLVKAKIDCPCGYIWGHYQEDGRHVTVDSNAILIGLANEDFHSAIWRWDETFGKGIRAWIINDKAWDDIHVERIEDGRNKIHGI